MTILFWIFVISLVIFLILYFGEKIKSLINYKTYAEREQLRRQKLGYTKRLPPISKKTFDSLFED